MPGRAGLWVRLLAVCVIAGLAVAPTATAATIDQSVAYQLDPAHDGWMSGFNLSTPLTKQWSATFAGNVSYPLVVNGVVYVAASPSSGAYPELFAIDQATGAVLWQHGVGTASYAWVGLAYDAGRVFAINEGGLLTAFNSVNGHVDWSVQLPDQWMFDSPPTAVDGVVYDTGAGEGATVYANSEATGAPLWTRSDINGSDDSSPAVLGNNVYLAFSLNYWAFNRATGATAWWDSSGSGGGGRTPVVADGHVFIRDEAAAAKILSASDGSVQGPLDARTAPAIANGVAYEFNGHDLQAVADDGLGTIQWTFSGDGQLDSAPVVIGSTVWIGSQSGELYAVDAGSGAETWSTNVGSLIEGPDEHNVTMLTGLGAGDGGLVVSAGNTLVAYAPPSKNAPPSNTTRPSVDGQMFVGNQIAADAGAWSNMPSSFEYEWERCDDSGANCASIPGATGPIYDLVAADAGARLRVVVTAVDAAGRSQPEQSDPSDVVQVPSTSSSGGTGTPAAAAPVVQSPPALSGAAAVGSVLSATPGTWTGTAPIGYSYQWMLCGDTCTAIPGATNSTFTITSADAGGRLQVIVAAANAAGVGLALSPASDVVPAPASPSSKASQTPSSTVSAVSSTGSSAPSSAPKTAAANAKLRRQIVIRASGSALLKRGGANLAISAPAAGRVVIDWVLPATRTSGSKVLIATGQLKFGRAGTRTVHLRLTKAGLSILRGHKQTRPIVALAEFIPTRGQRLVAQRQFRLSR